MKGGGLVFSVFFGFREMGGGGGGGTKGFGLVVREGEGRKKVRGRMVRGYLDVTLTLYPDWRGTSRGRRV